MAAVQLLLAGMHGADPWLVVLRHRLQTQPEPATHEEAEDRVITMVDSHTKLSLAWTGLLSRALVFALFLLSSRRRGLLQELNGDSDLGLSRHRVH